MKEIKLYKTPWKAIRLFVISIVLVCIGVWMVSNNDFLSKGGIIGLMATCFLVWVLLLHFFIYSIEGHKL